jgi:nucleoside-diphosphate-sugar epimerase
MSHVLILGLGYSGAAIARRLAGARWSVTATSTTAAGAERIRSLGHEGLVYDGSAASAALAASIASATHLVMSAAPDALGDPLLRYHASDIARSTSLAWIGYLSTVGVYGTAHGAWVDESCPLDPGSDRSRRRAAAERAWLDLAADTGKRVLVFRLSGIYGPGRSAIDSMRNGTARRIIKPGQVFNRIHVEDIALCVEAAIRRGGHHDIYNVTDDYPCPPQEVIEHAAELLGLPPPPAIAFEEAELSPMARSFYAENKRVSNARLKGDLGIRLRYPTYREGLAAVLRAQDD